MWRERIRARSEGNWFIFFFLLFFWDYNLLLNRDGVDGEIGVDGETDRDGRSGGLRSLICYQVLLQENKVRCILKTVGNGIPTKED